MEVLATDGAWLPIGFAPGTAGLWRTAYTDAIDFRSMLDGLVRIRHAGTDDGGQYKHLPRTVIPLIYDELQSAYVESERLQLGVDSLLLVRNAATTQAPAEAADEVEQVLRESARPGFRRIEKLSGMPEGWVLFTDVQLFGAPATNTKFNELVPLARNQLTIAGGLRIPSRIRKWSTLSRPEIRATVQSETRLRVTLMDSMGEDLIGEWASDTGVLVASLDELDLDGGDYQVALFTGSKTAPVQQASIRLRSSKDVDVQWQDAPRLTYSLSRPLGALSASEGTPDGALVDGLSADGDSGVKPTVAATGKMSWGESRTTVQPATIQIGTPDPKSCVITGAHHIQLPPALGGRAPRIIQGECTSCGLVKRYPGWLPRNGWRQRTRKPTATPHAVAAVTVKDLAPVGEHNVRNWDAALDALMHLGGGPISSLESIAMQLEGSALFVDNFIRALEALGHISIERDDRWQPARWEISPSCLGQDSDAAYRLAGFWPPTLRKDIETMASRCGGRVQSVPSTVGPTNIFVTGVSDDDAASIADDAPIVVAAEAGNRMLAALPRLSEVADALPRSPMIAFQSAERFDVASASWVRTGDPAVPGAYRLRRGFETTYVYRSKADIESGSAAIATVHLAKQLAANSSGKSLVCYHAKTQSVLLPQGCDLPGLYGRAAVAMAGRLPGMKKVAAKADKRTCLAYSGIDQDSADLLVTLLTT